jgi:outer membrane lipoprotein-sorting protein
MRIVADRDQAEIFSKAISAQLAAKSYRVRMESTRESERSARLLEHVSPQCFRVVSDTDEIIIVGQSTFQRVTGRAWQRIPFDVGSVIGQFLNPNVIEELTQGTAVTFNGTEMLDEQLMLVFQSIHPKALGTDITTISKIWISEETGLLCRMEMESEVKGIQTRTVSVYFDYNADIQIEPPV